MDKLSHIDYVDPRELPFSFLNLNSLKRIADKLNLEKKGNREEILKRFLTSFISLREFLEIMRITELRVISRKLKISPLPVNRNEAIERISNSINEKFYTKDSLQVLNFKYNIIRSLGEGGQGKTFLCREKLTDRLIVIKLANRIEDESFLSRELKVLASIDHPNIIRLYTYEIVNDSQIFLIIEFFDGSIIQKSFFEDKTIKLDEKEKFIIIKQLLDGLDYLHNKNIYHGDINPWNIMISNSKNYTGHFIIKYIDFGASLIGLENLSDKVQNNYYSAPEITNKKFSNSTSDVYSLSIIIAEVLAENYLYYDLKNRENTNFLQWWLNEHIHNSEIKELLTFGLQPDPFKRIVNGLELKRNWLSFLQNKINGE